MTKVKKTAWLTVLAVIITFISFYYFGIWPVVGQLMDKFFSPVERLFYNWSLTITKVNQLNEIFEENEYLKKELSKMDIDYVKLATLATENEYLRNELNFLQQNKFNYQLADVISKQLYNEQILYINKGSRHGLMENLAVTVGQGIIVGKVVDLSSERAKVQLLTDLNSELTATQISELGTTGLVKGQPGQSLIMEYIPQNINLQAGDLIITSGLEEHIPRGLVIGQVSNVEKLVGQIFQKAYLQPPFDYRNLQQLTIILPADQD